MASTSSQASPARSWGKKGGEVTVYNDQDSEIGMKIDIIRVSNY